MYRRKHLALSFVIVALASAILAAACQQAAPVPSPTTGPAAAPTKAPAPPTQAPTAAPTKAPAKVDFPTAGKSITMLVPWAAGGGTDVGARLLAPLVEKELGAPVQVVNRPGAGSQVGIAEFVRAKPDGYTLGATNMPSTNSLYLEPERQATFSRKDFQLVALHVDDPGAVAVKVDSPFKDMKDLVDAARAKPKTIKASTTGLKGSAHLAALQVERATGAEFALVHFDGFAPAQTALLGGHIDVQFGYVGEFLPQVKSGNLRILGVMDREQSKYYSGVKTFEEQGIKLYWASARGWSVPAGTPKEIVNILSAAIKRSIETQEHQQKMDEMGLTLRYMNPDQFTKYWDEVDAQVEKLLELAK